MATVWTDVRYAARRLAATPGFTLAVVLTLALGLGVNTAMFTALEAMVYRSLPYPDADRLVFVWGHRPASPMPLLPVSLPVALTVGERSHSLDRVEAWTSLPDTRFSLTDGGNPIDVQYAVVSSGLLPMLGAQPVRGRGFTAADDRMGTPRVAMISGRLWQDRFAAADDVVGRSLSLDGDAYTVVGILPSSFRFVDYPRSPDVWLPLGSDPFQARRFAPMAAMGIVAHLAPGATVETARAELGAIARAIGRDFPPLRDWTLIVRTSREQLSAARQPLVLALTGAATLVLLLACTNVAGLLLIRASGRDRELAVRTAVGASPARIVRLLLTESVILSVGGSLCGLLVAEWTRDVLATLVAGDHSPFVPWRLAPSDLALNPAAVVFAVLLAVVTGVMFGLVPALQSRHATPLKDGSRLTSRRGRWQAALVAVQVALSLVLLTGAGLLTRSFAALAAVDPGFVAAHAIAVDLALPARAYGDPARIVAFADRLTVRVQASPGVAAAGASDQLPLTGPVPPSDFRIEGGAEPEPGKEPRTQYSSASPGWFQASGVRLARGRFFTASDDALAARVAIINDAMARKYFAGVDPLGRRIALSNEALRFVAPDRPPIHDFPAAYRVIVGVVADVRAQALDAGAQPALIMPLAQHPTRQLTFVVRTADDPRLAAAAVADAVHDIDPAQPIAGTRTLEDVVAAATGESRLRAQLTAAFAVLALLLAAIGIYAAVAYAVAQRTFEIGVRLALGARSAHIVGLSARHGLVPAAIGLVVGLPCAGLAAAALERLLFDVPAFDRLTFAAALAILLGLAAVASWVPARRAGAIDPIRALRVD